MSKRALFIVTVVLLMVMNIFTSCQTGKTSYKSISIYATDNNEFESIIEVEKDADFSSEEYQDENAPKNMEYVYFGENYNLKYFNSAKYEASEKRIRVYKTDDEFNGSGFFFDESTGEIIRAWGIPHNLENLTEEKCVSMIKTLVGNRIDLEDLDMRITTQYIKRKSDKWSESVVEDGFNPCSREDEFFEVYSFYYNKTCNGIVIPQRVTAEFSEKYLTIEIIDFDNVEESDIEKIKSLDNAQIKNDVYHYLNDRISDGYKVKQSDITSLQYRRYNGEIYILATVNVEVIDTKSQDQYSYWIRIKMALCIS